jgi:hypothetical protein
MMKKKIYRKSSEREKDTAKNRRRSKRTKKEESAVASIQFNPTKEIEINHTPEMRGAFAEMAKKGTIRFTSYSTTEKE